MQHNTHTHTRIKYITKLKPKSNGNIFTVIIGADFIFYFINAYVTQINFMIN